MTTDQPPAEFDIAAAEDFRHDMALQAYTAPDADYDTIRASLAARIADLCGNVR